MKRIGLSLVGVLLCTSVQAELKLPSIIGDNMVLQRDQPVPIWGWDEPGTRVTVKAGNQTVAATANNKGRWLAQLAARKASADPIDISIQGTSAKVLKNVLFGEVWLCSGQSNMEWRVRQSNNPNEEIAAAKHPRIRHIKIPHTPAFTPQQDVPSDGWMVCSPETVSDFTAVGYYFGRYLLNELDVPIGLIGSNWGGTRIEPWTPPVGFAQVPSLSGISDNLDKFPSKRDNGQIIHQSPLALYNGMIHPLLPYAIRGAIWYQGESNNGEGMLYAEKMKALVKGWRSVWNNDKLPFYFVQLAPYKYRGDSTRLAEIWEAQLAALSMPHTGMAVTVDIGNVSDIHPKNKQDVGKRLALWALSQTYGKEAIVYSGPLYRSMKMEGHAIRITFDHVGGGLVSRDDKPLTWFQIAGPDKKFVKANAKVDGNTLLVSADGVTNPVAVRFAWDQQAEPNLSNKEGLPASPFRTDKW